MTGNNAKSPYTARLQVKRGEEWFDLQSERYGDEHSRLLAIDHLNKQMHTWMQTVPEKYASAEFRIVSK